MKGNYKRERIIALRIFIFFASIYFFSASFNFYSIDAGMLRIELARSIVERLDFNIPEGMGIKGMDGRDYSWVGIGSALLAVPFFIVAKALGGNPEISIAIMNLIFGAGTCVLVYLFSISLGYSIRASVLTSIFFGLGTFVWPLAKHPFDHIVETFFILLTVYTAYHYLNGKRVLYLLISAFSLGFAFITRQTSILIIPPLLIMAIYHYKKDSLKKNIGLLFKDIVLWSLVFLPFLIIFFWYNYYRFGSIFETGYQLGASRIGLKLYGETPFLTGITGYLISPSKGFFYYSPIAILFFFSIKNFIKKHKGLFICFSLIITIYLFSLSGLFYWHGDWAWGPRYILVLTPFFMIPIAELLDSKKWSEKKYQKMVLVFVFIISFVIQIGAVSVVFYKYFINLKINERIKFLDTGLGGLPPHEIYFDCKRSPIIAQFGFIYEMAKNISKYKYFEPPKDATIHEMIMSNLHMNVFDFWWLHLYFVDRNYSGFIMAFMLFINAILIWMEITKILGSDPAI